MSTKELTKPAPSFDTLLNLVLNSLPSPQSKRAYSRALQDFLGWFQNTKPRDGFRRSSVLSYRSLLLDCGLSASSVNLRMSAIRKLALEAADNGLMEPDLAQGISRIPGVKRLGVRTGNWLTVDQAEKLLNSPNPETLIGKRDRALLAVLIGCGLRREEAANLTSEHIQMRDARWVILDIRGKGNRVRTVPMPSWCKQTIDLWMEAAGEPFFLGYGSVPHLFWRIRKGNKITTRWISPQTIMDVVRRHSEKAGLGKLSPHDLRRTFAKLAHKGKAALEQIQLSLGHSSIQTTERYLGVTQDLTDAPCDHLGIKI